MPERFVAVGNIVEDTSLIGPNVIGGGVVYGSLAGRELGFQPAIISKFPKDHRFVLQLKSRGVDIIPLSMQTQDTVTFTNSYDDSGRRKQMVEGRSEYITNNDLAVLNDHVYEDTLFFVAPVIGEVKTEVISQLSQLGLVAVSPQGYFREIREGGEVVQKDWEDFEEDLEKASFTILSDEDITMNGSLNKNTLDKIKNSSSVTVLTKGAYGATIHGDNDEFSIHAFPLKPDEINDLTGAGDVFSAAFLAKITRTGDIYNAAVFAALFAAIKITATDGGGIDSIPTLQQLEEFIQVHPQEVRAFLNQNSADESAIKI